MQPNNSSFYAYIDTATESMGASIRASELHTSGMSLFVNLDETSSAKFKPEIGKRYRVSIECVDKLDSREDIQAMMDAYSMQIKILEREMREIANKEQSK